MEIRENKNILIIAPICTKVDKFKSDMILEKIISEKRQVAIDLKYVQDCSIEFINTLKSLPAKRIGVFNIPSDIFVLFNIMKVDKLVNLFVSEIDFKENSRLLINRQFRVL